MQLAPGSRLGHFEIVSSIGAGGMGQVYRARDHRLGRDVAIKVMIELSNTDETHLLRFQREARAIAALSHPNILVVYDLDTDPESGVMFLATELLEGETLRMHLTQGAPDWRRTAAIGASVAEGLAAAHAKGIVHRDLKPENIFMTSDGQIKILDFGLASNRLSELAEVDDAGETERMLTQPGQIMGTVAYMSPEQLRGQKPAATSDIFSLGSILFESASGARLFARASQAETVAAILREDLAFGPLEAAAPHEFVSIIRRCLSKSSEDRYQSARDLAFDLRAISSTGAVPRAEAVDARSIAILPFDNASSDPDAEYFSDGITESIMGKLSQLPALRVVARSTVFRYKGSHVDPQAAGASLNVRLVLSGRVQQRRDRLTIAAELTDVVDGRQLWGERYHRSAEDIFAIEEEIASEISDRLRIRLTEDERERLGRRHTGNTEAYHAYLRGRFEWNKRSEAALHRSVTSFREALEKDSGYPLAYAGLADSYNILGFYSLLPPSDAFPKAEAAAMRALEIDDMLAEAHASLGYALFYHRWDTARATESFKKAIALREDYPIAHQFYANLLAALGRFDESLAQFHRTVELDPLSLIANAATGWCLYMSRDYAAAEEQLRRTLAIDDSFGLTHIWLSHVLRVTGRTDDALIEARSAVSMKASWIESLAAQACALVAGGDSGSAREILERLLADRAQRFVQPYEIAAIQLALDDRAAALQSLHEALDIRSHRLVFLGVDPAFDALRGEPELERLLGRVGLA
ncbi:MAG TPA: protein kinase [Thermoanaerobaculia bacterium]|nr:protein kinase [Thermoanaerobaculia bacterium]